MGNSRLLKWKRVFCLTGEKLALPALLFLFKYKVSKNYKKFYCKP